MCYQNCPYENFDGECVAGKQIPFDGYCQEDSRNWPDANYEESEEEEEDNALEN
jgi:hypothetical protein